MKSTWILLSSFVLIGCLLFLVSARGRRMKESQKALANSQLDSSWDVTIGMPVIPPDHPSSVTFEIKPESIGPATTQKWLATYTADNHTAQFEIEMDRPARTEMHGILLSYGKGRFTSVANSDDSSLLQALAFALGGVLPKNVVKQSALTFDYVHFGDHLSPIPDGGFKFKPAGDWTATKLFFDGKTEDDSATVYLSLNPVAGHAQLSMSNGDYGDPILRHLASVL